MKRLIRRLLALRLVRSLVIRFMLWRERRASGISYDPLSSQLHADPYPIYEDLRTTDPVHRTSMMQGWVLSRHADVDAVLRDHRRFSSDFTQSAGYDRERRAGAYDRALEAAGLEEVQRDRMRRAFDEPNLLGLDPPDHTRLRSLVNTAFTPRQVEIMRPRIEAVVDELLDEAGDGRIDMMEAIADPLPTVVIAEMLGVPAQDRVRFKQWSNAVARQLEPTTQPHERVAATRANSELTEYFDDIIEQRRAEPRDDLISALIAAEEEGDKLTREQMVGTLVLLLVAGNETTTNLIGNGLLALLRHPDQLERLRDDPDLMKNAVEEMLRYDSPVQMDVRRAVENTVIGGREIEAGQQVTMLLGAANRDPEVFAEPDRLDLGRDVRDHVAFARGNHYCLGAPLARAEGQIAFSRLLDRYSEMRLVGDPEFKDHIVLRGMKHLWVDVKRSNGADVPASAKAATI